MIETLRLRNVVIFIQTILSFVLPRKSIKMYNDIARKYGNVTVKDFRKLEWYDFEFPKNARKNQHNDSFLLFEIPKYVA